MKHWLSKPAWVVVCATLVLTSHGRPDADGSGQDPASASTMEQAAASFRCLASALEGRDALAVAASARSLCAVFSDAARIRPLRNTELQATLAAQVAETAQSCVDIEQAATAGDLALAERSFAGLRAACVACHLRFRADDEAPRVPFPARHNALTGVIELLTVTGDERDDRSGVVVFLEGSGLAGAPWPPPRKRRISQAGALFEPRVLPVLVGASVEFPNDDLIFHNVFSLSETAPFDLGAYGPGQTDVVRFPRAGLVRVFCNIHPQMVSSVLILSNPYFATTDRRGMFVIPEVPDGDYALRIWHEFAPETKEQVTVSGATVVTRSWVLREDRATLPHKNKFGLPYRDKY